MTSQDFRGEYPWLQYRVVVSKEHSWDEVDQWISEHLRISRHYVAVNPKVQVYGDWKRQSMASPHLLAYWFRNESDAVMFKLRWG